MRICPLTPPLFTSASLLRAFQQDDRVIAIELLLIAEACIPKVLFKRLRVAVAEDDQGTIPMEVAHFHKPRLSRPLIRSRRFAIEWSRVIVDSGFLRIRNIRIVLEALCARADPVNGPNSVRPQRLVPRQGKLRLVDQLRINLRPMLCVGDVIRRRNMQAFEITRATRQLGPEF